MHHQCSKEADQMPTCLWRSKTWEGDVALFLSVVEDRALIPPLSNATRPVTSLPTACGLQIGKDTSK